MENQKKICKADTPNTAKEWVLACEAEVVQQMAQITENILAQKHTRFLRLSGPTCSGKTTAAQLLTECFAAHGKRLHSISLDDFYYDKSVLHTLSDIGSEGKIDYDSVKTIDLAALRRLVMDLSEYKTGQCPIFDFKEGKRIGYRSVTGTEEDEFLFEGIQAMYPEVIAILEETGQHSVGIYIAPCRSVSADGVLFEPNELRLLRRLVRDYRFRGTEPDFTLTLWESVRQNEEMHIFPYADTCAYVIDSAMSYEPGMLKPFLLPILERVPKESPNRPLAEALLGKFADISPLSDALLPPGALYREFL